MNKKLAIKGHSTRGNEVIELLEMMGGKNTAYHGTDINVIYAIDDKGIIRTLFFDDSVLMKMEYNIFTLKEFLEKYPFKVGDKVFDKVDVDPGIITAMKWDEDVSNIKYHVMFDNGNMGWYTNDMIGSLKLEEEKAIDLAEKCYEEQCDEMNKTQTKENDVRKTGYTLNELIDLVPLTSDSIMIAVREGFEIIEEQGKFFLKKKKSTYPTTYAECCDVLSIAPYYNLRYHTYEPAYDEYATSNTLLSLENKLNTLGKLIICRDAYWKIAGEEMGLDKPWEPRDTKDKYIIRRAGDTIVKGYNISSILEFPTEEMRDVFYENFKDLIEQCKELL